LSVLYLPRTCSELRLAEAKLQSTEKELDSLSVERLKHGASVYRCVCEREREVWDRTGKGEER
jgi:hypothetical protein